MKQLKYSLTGVMVLFSMVLNAQSVYDFSFKTVEGKLVKLSDFKGKKMLIVNTASKCGYTPQYEELEKVQQQYGKDIVLIGFPSGNFGGQEFDTNAEIQNFCSSKFHTSFLLAEKTVVKGEGISTLFAYLTSAANPDFTGDIKWNFEKFLIDENGKLIRRFRSAVTPLDKSITANF